MALEINLKPIAYVAAKINRSVPHIHELRSAADYPADQCELKVGHMTFFNVEAFAIWFESRPRKRRASVTRIYGQGSSARPKEITTST